MFVRKEVTNMKRSMIVLAVAALLAAMLAVSVAPAFAKPSTSGGAFHSGQVIGGSLNAPAFETNAPERDHCRIISKPSGDNATTFDCLP